MSKKSFFSIPILAFYACLSFALLFLATPRAYADFTTWSDDDFSPSGLNSNGSVAVGHKPVGVSREAVIWELGIGFTSLGYLPGGSSGSSSANAVSGDGSIVVGDAYSTSGTQAFRWTKATGMVGMGDLPGGSFFSVADDISTDGKVIVGYSSAAAGTEAFRWTESAGMQSLGVLPGGFHVSRARAVNSDGSVIVGYSGSGPGVEAFRWTASGGMVGLGDLPGGSFRSEAYDVSADGSVVVGDATTADGSEAFRWTEKDGMQGLGDLPGGLRISTARAVSGNGAIVVGVSVSDIGGEVYRWSQPTGMKSLHSLLDGKGVPVAGFELENVSDISDDGTIIIGEGKAPDGSGISWIAKYDDGFAGLTTFEDVNKSLEDLSTLTPRISGMSLLTLRSLLETQRYSEDSLTSFWGLGTFGTDYEFSGDDINGYGAVGMTHFWRSGWSFGGGVFVGNTTIESSFGGQQNSTLVGPGLFVGYMPNPTGLHVKLGAMYNYANLKLDRAYSNGSGTTSSEGDTDGHVLGGVAHIAWLFALQNMFIVQPFFQYEVQEIKINEYKEETGPLPAKYDSRDFVTNKTRLGLEAGYLVKDDLTLSVWGAWNHRYEDEGPSMKGELIGVTSFDYGKGEIDQDWGDTGLKVSWLPEAGAELILTVGFAFDNQYYAAPDQYVQVGFSVDF